MGKYDELVEKVEELHTKFAGQAGRNYTSALFGEIATAITTLEAELAAMKARGDRLAKALGPFAYYYDLNDCDKRPNYDALEVPTNDLLAASQALTEWRDQ